MAGSTSKRRAAPKLRRPKNIQYEKWEKKDRKRLTFYAPDKIAETIRQEAFSHRSSQNAVIVKLLEFAIESRPTMIERPAPA